MHPLLVFALIAIAYVVHFIFRREMLIRNPDSAWAWAGGHPPEMILATLTDAQQARVMHAYVNRKIEREMNQVFGH